MDRLNYVRLNPAWKQNMLAVPVCAYQRKEMLTGILVQDTTQARVKIYVPGDKSEPSWTTKVTTLVFC